MAHFDTKFDPRVMQVTKPDGTNMLNAAGNTLSDVLTQHRKYYVDGLKVDDLEAKRRDEKKLVKQVNKGQADMETLSGATMAAKLRAPKKSKGVASRGRRTATAAESVVPESTSALSRYNSHLIPAPTAPTKTVTVYRDGKPITVQIKG